MIYPVETYCWRLRPLPVYTHAQGEVVTEAAVQVDLQLDAGERAVGGDARPVPPQQRVARADGRHVLISLQNSTHRSAGPAARPDRRAVS